MKRFLSTLAAACLLIVGCQENGSNTPAPTDNLPVVKVEDREIFANATYNPLDRHFAAVSAVATLPQIHAAYVQEFISVESTFGGGRRLYLGPSSSPNWVEYVPNESAQSIIPQPRADGHPDALRYDDSNGVLHLADGTQKTVRERHWNLKNHRLLSIRKAGESAVYLHDHPNMNLHKQMTKKDAAPSKTIPTRPLDAFEAESLQELQAGSELVVKTTPIAMKLVGAIRAQTDCLKCHTDVEKGALLGAFTYDVQVTSIATKDADRLQDLNGFTEEQAMAVEAIEAVGGRLTRDASGAVTAIDMTIKVEAGTTLGTASAPNFVYMFSNVRNPEVKLLKAFPEVREVNLSNCHRVSDEAVADLSQLKGLKKLMIEQTRISDDGITKLKQALPGCDIRYTARPKGAPGVELP